MQQRSGPHYQRLRDEWIRPGKLGKITLVRTWWHGNSTHLRKAPASLQVKPANLDWARYLGPVKWRDWDPQQYANFRAYLDFGGGQVTDLFTHWIDAVHMIMGQELPISAVAAGGVYSYKDGRTAPDTINLVLEYPGEWNVTFEATLVPVMSGAAIEFCGTEGRALITRGQFEIYPVKSAKPAGACRTAMFWWAIVPHRHHISAISPMWRSAGLNSIWSAKKSCHSKECSTLFSGGFGRCLPLTFPWLLFLKRNGKE
jgi:predicted dehydrogenase